MTENTPGDYWVKVSVNTGSEVQEDSIFVSYRIPVSTQDPPAGTKPGVNYLDSTRAIISLIAPAKDFIHLLGEFNDWLPNNLSQMKKGTDGNTWWLEIEGLEPQKEYAYQFLIDGTLTVADPYAHKILDPFHDGFIDEITYPNLREYPAGREEIVSVLQTSQLHMTGSRIPGMSQRLKTW